jgi:hypothetical protein
MRMAFGNSCVIPAKAGIQFVSSRGSANQAGAVIKVISAISMRVLEHFCPEKLMATGLVASRPRMHQDALATCALLIYVHSKTFVFCTYASRIHEYFLWQPRPAPIIAIGPGATTAKPRQLSGAFS